MNKLILAVCAAFICAFVVSGPAFAVSRLTVHRRAGIPLPAYVTSNRYWLYAGRVRISRGVYANYDYIRLVAEPIGNIVPVGPDYGFPWP